MLKEKSQALDSFKSFKAIAENESGCKIKTLRSDRGGEYVATADFLKESGIKHHQYTPQQNGVAERKKQNHYGASTEYAKSQRYAKKVLG